MNRAFLSLVCALALMSEAYSQDPEVPPTVAFTYDAGLHDYIASWLGVAGKTYYIQHSEDLITWNYVGEVAVGTGAQIDYWAPLKTHFSMGGI